MTAASSIPAPTLRAGIDLGGTKIEGVLLGPDGQERARRRIATPRGDYDRTIAAIAQLLEALEQQAGERAAVPVGLAIPGSLSRRTGLVHNANSTWLNGRALDRDLHHRLGRPVAIANDANCFALSEATDGAGQGCRSVFGVILGTGCGGALVHKGALIDGPLGIAGEWGHNPLPWAQPDEYPGPECWCGRHGCMEAWVCGPALADDHARNTGSPLTAEDIAAAAAGGDAPAGATLRRHASRLGRGLAHVVNVFDPDVIVLGGGLSKLAHLYAELPRLMFPYIFADAPAVDVRPAKWGDASGVRGAAWLAGS
ncbi:MAG TPA: ROK family protein [Hyphomicrobium sp.]|nr:ROK family protein [Hyphomicrobium sp.]